MKTTIFLAHSLLVCCDYCHVWSSVCVSNAHWCKPFSCRGLLMFAVIVWDYHDVGLMAPVLDG